MNIVRKPKYIRKYDFIRYFTRNKDEWFWLEIALEKYVEDKILFFNQNHIDVEVEEEDEKKDIKCDPLTIFKESKESNEDIDQTNPKIFEGNLIDKECRKYITYLYKDCKVIDFDNECLNNEQSFEKTLNIIKNQNNVILFQPTFIYKNKAIAKPDAIIKKNGKYILIETKGTSTTKLSHLVDIQYQINIVDEVLNQFDESISECKLCIVAYEKKNKNQLSFILTDYCNYQKSGASVKTNDENRFSDAFIKIKQSYKDGTKNDKKIIDCVQGKVSQFSKYKDLVESNFDKIIDELQDAQISHTPSLKPCLQYKGWLKDASHWNLLKEYYFVNPEYIAFSYSGNLINYQHAYEYVNTYFENSNQFLQTASQRKTNKVFDRFYGSFKHNDANRIYKKYCSFSKFTIDKLKTIKNKKVYFDFESLNTAVRVVDNSLPFMQAINQVSVIFDHGDGKLVKKNNQTGCNNIIIDPLVMNIEDYKTIVDAIFPNEKQDEYSYIVYNKNFEVTRLKEIKYLLNDEAYSKKIEIIIKNIFDLADFFDLRNEAYIFVEELHAFYSIKKVLPIVQKYAPDIFIKTGCKDYKKLQIHNGNQAQTESTKRLFNLLSNQEWEKKSISLKTYCENDVRAMIAVEYFIRNLII